MTINFTGLASGNDRGVVRFGPHRFWAERGLIHCEDSRDNSFNTYSVATMLRRMSAISDMLGNSTDREIHSEDQFDQANRARHQRMLEGMVDTVRKAQEQGMPSDATARRDLARRRPLTLVVPGLRHSM
jgi:hypothetical protein